MSMIVTTRDIVIPAGTEVSPGPTKSEYLTPHGEVLIAFTKDTTGSLRFELEEAIAVGLVTDQS